MITYFIYRDIMIAVDAFSSKKTAVKPGSVTVLDSSKDLKKQLYEALSGNKWDEVIERIDRRWENGLLSERL